jgi:tellurite resistance protein
MTRETDARIEQQIEETQAALRRTIEDAKDLAEKAQKLLQKHKNIGQAR